MVLLTRDDDDEVVEVELHKKKAAAAPAPISSAPVPASHTYLLRGVTVEFPYPAYECQVVFMERVIEALQIGCNALLESPTGTGKTLCLLCATLAWRKHTIAQMEEVAGNGGQMQQQSVDVYQSIMQKVLQSNGTGGMNGYSAQNTSQGGFVGSGDPNVSINTTTTLLKPRIIYASRTHSQLTQVVDELKGTSYSQQIAILGSRQQLCVHPEVSKLSGTHQNHSCQAKTAARTCKYKENLNTFETRALRSACLDIEELVTMGKEQIVCPYYWQMDARHDAEVLFMPYNYLLSPDIRNRLNLQLDNAVVIFDEAHNLESVCADSASFDLTATDISTCMAEADACLDIAMKNADVAMSSKGPVTKDEICAVKNIFVQLEQAVHTVDTSKNGRTYDGSYIFDLFTQCGVTFDYAPTWIDMIERLIDALFSQSAPGDGGANDVGRRQCTLDKFNTALRMIYRKSDEISRACSQHYKVHIHAPPANPQAQTSNRPTYFNASQSQRPPVPASQNAGNTLSYWCFNSGITMNELSACRIRSILLASGTLSPLQSYAAELGVPFPVRLENPHVIADEQVFVSVVERGPASQSMNSSYANRGNTQYTADLGAAIINIARATPDGMLVFFPSYTAMTATLAAWRQSPGYGKQSVMERLEQRKGVIIEPKTSNAFAASIDEFERLLSDPQFHGALFFAVCRGKVSEGLDFADRHGRAVVVTGLPYPNLKDAKVMLKRQFLDVARKRDDTQLSGDAWYQQQSARALNQAIGRVIRHRRDFGAIILLDERFAYNNVKSGLSMWLRPRITVHQNFGAFASQLSAFFRHGKQNLYDPPLPSSGELVAAKERTASYRTARVDSLLSQNRSQQSSFPSEVAEDEVGADGRRVVPTASAATLQMTGNAATHQRSNTTLLQTLRSTTAPAATTAVNKPTSNGLASTLSQSLSRGATPSAAPATGRSLSAALAPKQAAANTPPTVASGVAVIKPANTAKQPATNAAASNMSALTQTLKSAMLPEEYNRVKTCITQLSKLQKQQPTEQQIIAVVSPIQDIFMQSSARQSAGRLLCQSLPSNARPVCLRVWQLDAEPGTAVKPVRTQSIVPGDGYEQVGQPRQTVITTSPHRSASGVPASTQSLGAARLQFIQNVRGTLSADQYSAFKQLVVQIEAISPAVAEPHLTTVLQPLFHRLLSVFHSSIESWALADEYARICHAKHRPVYQAELRQWTQPSARLDTAMNNKRPKAIEVQ